MNIGEPVRRIDVVPNEVEAPAPHEPNPKREVVPDREQEEQKETVPAQVD